MTGEAVHPDARRHLRFGWWALLAFLTLGLVLEMMHAFKVAWYLSAASDVRRLLWTLAHAHGTLLAIVNIAYGLTLATLRVTSSPLASRCFIAATLLLPVGFLAGGTVVYGGDPNPAVALVPVGAVLLIVAVLIAARSLPRDAPGP